MYKMDEAINIDEQIELMKRYIVFKRKTKIKNFLEYAGYFRVSRYAKYLLSFSNEIGSKPDQEMLFDLYKFDLELRGILFKYCKKAEIQFKCNVSNAISMKVNDSTFYLKEEFYTPTKGEKDKLKREANKKWFKQKFIKRLVEQERNLRQDRSKFPELKEYRDGGTKNRREIPCWAAFSYYEFGTITNIYAYLRGDLKKEILVYGYSKHRYQKSTVKAVETWIDAIRNLRNICAHHNKLVGKTSSIVLVDMDDERDILINNTDLFSRIYALKKILNKKDSDLLKEDLNKIIKKVKFDIYKLNILPKEWEILFDRIKYL
ncbi:MAG: Abi family protein [Clostridium sp.]|uniref:Abi family protein n=1 Tax=Clostridium sp. TaxID=1506 RepID=UPI003F3521C9